MIFGECPYCNAQMVNYMPEHTPCAGKVVCPGEGIEDKLLGCGKTVWMWYSRIEPEAYTEDGFQAAFDIDEINKSVKRKP